MKRARIIILLLLFGLVWLIWPSPELETVESPVTLTPEAKSAMHRVSVPVDGEDRATEPEPAIAPPSLVFNGQVFSHRMDDAPQRAMVAARAAWGTNRAELVLAGWSKMLSAAERAQWLDQGIQVLAYVPDAGWLARVRGTDGEQPEVSPPITLFAPLDSRLRLDPALWAPCDCDELPVYIHVARDADARMLQRELRAHGYVGFTVHEAGEVSYLAGRVALDEREKWADLVGGHPDVQYVTRGQGARLMNFQSARILQSGALSGGLPLWEQGVYGSNQVIAVLDTGLDADSCYFRDVSGTWPATNRLGQTNVNGALRKVIAADFLYAGDNPAVVTHWDNQGHGTSVAGHAAGADLAAPTGTNGYNGMAPGAYVVAQDGGFTTLDDCADLVGLGCPVTNFLPAMEQAYRHGARIHNNSWGDNENGVFTNLHAYTQAARDLDAMTWSHRDFLVVCAAGNSGSTLNTVASPSTAKNALSVAATQPGSGLESLASFSSRGWTEDGRVKPDLAAPGGFNVTSSSSDGSLATSNCATAGGGGTSFASPMVAGLAALVRDYFAQGFYPTGQRVATNAWSGMSAALVKALLIHASVPMSNAVAAPPARDQGWGRVHLSQALVFTNSAQVLWVAEEGARTWDERPGQPLVRYFAITNTNQLVKVTLVWTDYPGTPGAGKQLINDLDLLVRWGTNQFRGNLLTGGVSVAGGAFDRTNNVEQVMWRPVETGLVEVSVWAHVVPEPTQTCALVVSGPLHVLDPTEDSDADGIADVLERWHLGSLGVADATSDADGDQVRDGDELVAGTNPSNVFSYLRWEQLQVSTNEGWELSVQGVPGRRYEVQLAEPAEAGWEVWNTYSNVGAGRGVAGQPFSNIWLTFRDTFSSNDSGRADNSGARVYRVLVEAP